MEEESVGLLIGEYNLLDERISDLEEKIDEYVEEIDKMYEIAKERVQKINENIKKFKEEYLNVGFEIEIGNAESIDRKIEELKNFEKNLFLLRIYNYFDELKIKYDKYKDVVDYLLETNGNLIMGGKPYIKSVIKKHYEVEKEKGINLSILYQRPLVERIKELEERKSDIAKKLNELHGYDIDEKFYGYFLNNGKIVEGEIEIGKEYNIIELFDGNKIVNITEVKNLDNYTSKKSKVRFLGIIKNKNGDELYNLGNEKINKDYVLFEK